MTLRAAEKVWQLYRGVTQRSKELHRDFRHYSLQPYIKPDNIHVHFS
jgi:hypothetical protein